ncbi:MAG TPA: autoinducer 2 ABC transporter substrate-binding protein [Armatimonadota bacterium]|nr:autoinducer 2 ABC transporter substrate-binding protein [Armatimonadota bacterium]
MRVIRSYLITLALVVLSASVLGLGGCTRRAERPETTRIRTEHPKKAQRQIAFVMKLVGIPYTNACERGMKQAAKELGIDAVFLGPPTGGDTAQQIAIIEDQISRGVDAIIISPNDDQAVKPVIKRGISKGIKVFTWDSDAPESDRIFYVAAADDVGIGVEVIDRVAKDIGGKGKVAVMTGSPNALNLKLHVDGVEKGAKKYPGIQLVKPYIYNDDDRHKATQGAITLLQAHPDLAAFACVNAPGVPGAAMALIQTGKEDKVVIWGLSLPSENRDYIKKGIVNGLTLWDPAKLTYVTTKLVNDYLDGKKPVDGMEVPGIGKLKVSKDGVIIMPGATITKENIDRFDF